MQVTAAVMAEHNGALGRNDCGNTLVSFGIVFPLIAAWSVFGLDHAGAASGAGKRRAVTDAAALYAAREFQIVQANVEKVAAVARQHVRQIDGVAVDVAVDAEQLTVRVTLDKDVPNSDRSSWAGGATTHVQDQRDREDDERAAALPSGTGTESEKCHHAAEECAADRAGLRGQFKLHKSQRPDLAGRCGAAGGPDVRPAARSGPGTPTIRRNRRPTARSCRPLDGRQAPASPTCNFTDKVVSAATETLQPGVYCGGLSVTSAATVTLNPGIFIFRDGPLIVDRGASLKGNGVSIFMKGPNANLTFATASTILSPPASPERSPASSSMTIRPAPRRRSYPASTQSPTSRRASTPS